MNTNQQPTNYLYILYIIGTLALLFSCSPPSPKDSSKTFVTVVSAQIIDQPDSIADFSDQDLLARTDQDRLNKIIKQFNDEGFHLRIIGITVNKDVSLVTFSIALSETMVRPPDEITIIFSQVGLHAIASFVPYQEIRHEARKANKERNHNPTLAIETFAASLLIKGVKQHHLRKWMLFTALSSTLLFVFIFILSIKTKNKRVTDLSG